MSFDSVLATIFGQQAPQDNSSSALQALLLDNSANAKVRNNEEAVNKLSGMEAGNDPSELNRGLTHQALLNAILGNDTAPVVKDVVPEKDKSSKLDLNSMLQLLGLEEKKTTIEKNKQEIVTKDPDNRIAARFQQYKYGVPTLTGNKEADAQSLEQTDKDPEARKGLNNMEKNLVPALTASQQLLDFVSAKGVPKVGPERIQFEQQADILTGALMPLLNNGQGRFTPAMRSLLEDVQGKPKDWKQRWLYSDPQLAETNLMGLQKSLLDNAKSAYPGNITFNPEAVKKELSSKDLNRTIDNWSAAANQGDRLNSANDDITVRYTDKSGKAFERSIKRKQFGTAQNLAKQNGGKIEEVQG